MLLGFFCPLLPTLDNILFNEAACVLSALLWALQSTTARRILLITDSLDAVGFYHLLKSAPPYSHILMAYADALLGRPDVSVQVRHIDGERNTVADALLRLKFALLAEFFPSLRLSNFHFPPSTTGQTLCDGEDEVSTARQHWRAAERARST